MDTKETVAWLLLSCVGTCSLPLGESASLDEDVEGRPAGRDATKVRHRMGEDPSDEAPRSCRALSRGGRARDRPTRSTSECPRQESNLRTRYRKRVLCRSIMRYPGVARQCACQCQTGLGRRRAAWRNTVPTPPRLDRHTEEPCRHTGRRSITRSRCLTASLDLFLNQSDISAVGHGARHRLRDFDQPFALRSH